MPVVCWPWSGCWGFSRKEAGAVALGTYVLVDCCFMLIVSLSHSNGSVVFWLVLSPDGDSVSSLPRNSRTHILIWGFFLPL